MVPNTSRVNILGSTCWSYHKSLQVGKYSKQFIQVLTKQVAHVQSSLLLVLLKSTINLCEIQSETRNFRTQALFVLLYVLRYGAHVGHLIKDKIQPSKSRPMGELGGLGPVCIGPSLTHLPLDPKQQASLKFLPMWVLYIKFRFSFL